MNFYNLGDKTFETDFSIKISLLVIVSIHVNSKKGTFLRRAVPVSMLPENHNKSLCGGEYKKGKTSS